MRASLLALFLLVFGCSLAPRALAQKARISMSSSATQVTVGEPFAIEIRADVAADDVDDIEVPDFGKLEVLAQRVSRPMSFSFGFGSGGQHARIQSQIIHGYTLRALEPGIYTIQPAIMTIGGRKLASSPVTIHATGAALPGATAPPRDDPGTGATGSMAPPAGELSGARYDNDLFLRTVVDKPRVYVGEQVTVTIYLYVRGALTQMPAITREPTTEGFWIQDLLALQRTMTPVRQEINGRTFNVYVLKRFAAFPLRDGKLQVGAPAIEMGGGNSLFDLLTGPAQTVRRSGVVAAIDVSPLPARNSTAPSHVGELTLEASVDPSSAKVGDAVTLRVTAKGTGNLKSLKLQSPSLPGVEVLSPEVDDKLTNDFDILGGERSFRWLLLPRAPGSPSVPSFVVESFNPSTKAYSTVRTKPLPLTITGAALPTTSRPAEPSASQPASPLETKSFGPARLTSSLQRARRPLAKSSWYLWAVLLGPGLLAGFLLTRFGASRLSARRARNPGDVAMRGAEQKLADAATAAKTDAPRAYGSLLGALRAALQARLGEPVGGLTLPALRSMCLARGMPPELAERVISELTSCEQARFDPSLQETESVERHMAETRTILQQLARFTPRGVA